MPGQPHSRRQWFAIGLAVRLLGVALIALGDGHDTLCRKSLVIAGVILSIGGIAVLRVLLMAPLLGKLRRKVPAEAGQTGPATGIDTP